MLTRRVVAALLALGALPASTLAQDLPKSSVEQITARYGKPDRVSSSANDRPRPPMVTTFVEYRKEGVRFVLLADAPVGAPPPYRAWLLMGVQDMQSKKKLSAEEVTKRMASRLKK